MDDQPPLTDEQVQAILSHWRTTVDTCRDDPDLYSFTVSGHACVLSECGDGFVVVHREPTSAQWHQADRYIRVLAAEYPFQLRKAFAMNRLHAFLDMWESTRNFAKAMRVI